MVSARNIGSSGAWSRADQRWPKWRETRGTSRSGAASPGPHSSVTSPGRGVEGPEPRPDRPAARPGHAIRCPAAGTARRLRRRRTPVRRIRDPPVTAPRAGTAPEPRFPSAPPAPRRTRVSRIDRAFRRARFARGRLALGGGRDPEPRAQPAVRPRGQPAEPGLRRDQPPGATSSRAAGRCCRPRRRAPHTPHGPRRAARPRPAGRPPSPRTAAPRHPRRTAPSAGPRRAARPGGGRRRRAPRRSAGSAARSGRRPARCPARRPPGTRGRRPARRPAAARRPEPSPAPGRAAPGAGVRPPSAARVDRDTGAQPAEAPVWERESTAPGRAPASRRDGLRGASGRRHRPRGRRRSDRRPARGPVRPPGATSGGRPGSRIRRRSRTAGRRQRGGEVLVEGIGLGVGFGRRLAVQIPPPLVLGRLVAQGTHGFHCPC